MNPRRSALALILIISVLGCGTGGEKAVDVAGTVSLDGKPLEGVEVHFLTEKFEGYGKTNKEGKYRLVNGAIAGPNKVYLKKFDTAAVSGIDMSIPGMDEGQAQAKAAGAGNGVDGKPIGSIIPAEYYDPTTTKLTFEVPAGGTESADFRISSN